MSRVKWLAGALVIALVPSAAVSTAASQAAEPVPYVDVVYGASQIAVAAGVVYGSAPEVDPERAGQIATLRLDSFLPPAATGTARPAIVWIHGGGFRAGSRSSTNDTALEYARRGYATFSIDYRLDPGNTCQDAQHNGADPARCLAIILAALHDAQAAVRWVRAHAVELGVDPTKVAAGGFSAGAVTAANLAYMSDNVDESIGSPGYSSAVGAALLASGCEYLLSAIGPGDAPVAAIHAVHDQPVDYSCMAATADAARAHGLVVDLTTYCCESTHAGALYAKYKADTDAKWTGFLVTYLGLGAPLAGSAEYVGVTPERRLDTRLGLGAPAGKLAPGAVIELDVAGGTSAVPSVATAAVLNVTATEPDGDGYLTVWPCGQPQPHASNVNFIAGQTIPNLVIARTGSNGKVCLASSTATHVVADLDGWHPAGSTYVGVTPERRVDTRSGLGAPPGKLAPGTVIELDITGGASGVLADATAAVLNVTATEPARDGYLTVWPCGQPQPHTSNLNFTAGQTIANLVISDTGIAGTVCLASSTATHVVADLNGWYPAATTYTAVQPQRQLDTRGGLGAPAGKLAPGAVIELGLGLPALARAAVLNVTATQPDRDGYLTVWPCGQPQPHTSNLNFTAGQTIPNLVITGIGTSGKICLASLSPTHVVADLAGWYPAA